MSEVKAVPATAGAEAVKVQRSLHEIFLSFIRDIQANTTFETRVKATLGAHEVGGYVTNFNYEHE